MHVVARRGRSTFRAALFEGGGDPAPAIGRAGFARAECAHTRAALLSVRRLLGRGSQAALMILLRAYQAAVSPWLPPACRYSPTCSQYALEAVARHGAVRGLWMAARRLARCHPFHAGGYDPVR